MHSRLRCAKELTLRGVVHLHRPAPDVAHRDVHVFLGQLALSKSTNSARLCRMCVCVCVFVCVGVGAFLARYPVQVGLGNQKDNAFAQNITKVSLLDKILLRETRGLGRGEVFGSTFCSLEPSGKNPRNNKPYPKQNNKH